MTTIVYKKNEISISGHAGNPTVCHGISAISQMAANYLEDNRLGSVYCGDGHLRMWNIDEVAINSSLFNAMKAAFEDIQYDNPDDAKIIYEI